MEELPRAFIQTVQGAEDYRTNAVGRFIGDRAVEMTYIVTPEAHIQYAAEAIANGALPIVVGNHQSHFDAFPAAWMANLIAAEVNKLIAIGRFERTEMFPGFNMLMAASVTTGNQSRAIKWFYDLTRGWFLDNRVYPVPYVRGRDVQVYQETTKGRKETYALLKHELLQGVGLLVFPEGSVKPGRINKQGQRFGVLQLFRKTMLTMAIDTAHEERRPVLIIPVVNCGGYDIFDPDLSRPRKAAFEAMLHNLIKPEQIQLAFAEMLEPIWAHDLVCPDQMVGIGDMGLDYSAWKEMVILERISRNLPEELKGVFRIDKEP